MAHSNGYYAAINCLSLTRVVLSCFYRVLFIPKAFLFTSLSLCWKRSCGTIRWFLHKEIGSCLLGSCLRDQSSTNNDCVEHQTWFIDLQWLFPFFHKNCGACRILYNISSVPTPSPTLHDEVALWSIRHL